MFSRVVVCCLCVIALVTSVAPVHALQPKVNSPVDSLTPDEYWIIYRVLRDSGHLHEKTLFPSILLHEPEKSYVLAWKPGDPIEREADIVLYEDGHSYAALVDIAGKKVLDFKDLKGEQAPFTSTEEDEFNDIIKKDPRVIAALKKRGITDMNLVKCYATAAGYVGLKEQGRSSHRLGRLHVYRGHDAPDGSRDRRHLYG